MLESTKNALVKCDDLLTEMIAVETLEYHNKNHLCGSEKLRNEVKRNMLNELKTYLMKIRHLESLPQAEQ